MEFIEAHDNVRVPQQHYDGPDRISGAALAGACVFILVMGGGLLWLGHVHQVDELAAPGARAAATPIAAATVASRPKLPDNSTRPQATAPAPIDLVGITTQLDRFCGSAASRGACPVATASKTVPVPAISTNLRAMMLWAAQNPDWKNQPTAADEDDPWVTPSGRHTR